MESRQSGGETDKKNKMETPSWKSTGRDIYTVLLMNTFPGLTFVRPDIVKVTWPENNGATLKLRSLWF